MSLAPITKPSNFFSSCTSIIQVDSAPMARAFQEVEEALRDFKDKESMETLLNKLTTMPPQLWSSVPKNAPASSSLIQRVVQQAKSKETVKLCVQLGGPAILEVGDSYGETPLFGLFTYRSLKRLTDLGAKVNVRSKTSTVLERCMQVRWTGPEHHRCVKHLLRLGACIQQNSPLTEDERSDLTVIYNEFSKEITTVRKKIQLVAQHILVTDLQTIIFDYAWTEEDSETPVYDLGFYSLDDETEAYAFIKGNRAVSVL